MRQHLETTITGFIAAGIAVVLVHQTIILLLNIIGLTDRTPWSFDPVPPWGVPSLLNAIFWGGLWGSVLALLYDRLPGQAAALKGLFFGWLIYLFSNSLILPLIKGQPLFYGFEGPRMLSVFIILSGFGAATGWIFEWLQSRKTLRTP